MAGGARGVGVSHHLGGELGSACVGVPVVEHRGPLQEQLVRTDTVTVTLFWEGERVGEGVGEGEGVGKESRYIK